MTPDFSMFEGLSPVSSETLAKFDEVQALVENDVTQSCLASDDPKSSMGDEAESMIKNGLGFVSRMLRTSMSFAAGDILEDELDWGKTRLPVYGVSGEMVMRNFERYEHALKERLPTEAFAEVEPYLRGMMAMQRRFLGE